MNATFSLDEILHGYHEAFRQEKSSTLKQITGNSYLVISRRFDDDLGANPKLFYMKLQQYNCFNNEYKVFLVDKDYDCNYIKKKLIDFGFSVCICSEKYHNVKNFCNYLSSFDIVITNPKILHHYAMICGDTISSIKFIAFYNTPQIFKNGPFQCVKLIHPSTNLLIIVSDQTFDTNLFCQEYLSNYVVYCSDLKTIPNYLHHRTQFLTYDDKLSYIYQSMTVNNSICVISSNIKVSEILYNHFRRIKAFNDFEMTLLTSIQHDFGDVSSKKRVIFSSVLYFENNKSINSDLFIFFDFLFESHYYIQIINSIYNNQFFVNIVNLVHKGDFEVYQKLKQKHKNLFMNEIYSEYCNILNDEEFDMVNRSHNMDLFKSLEEIIPKREHSTFYSEFKNINESLVKGINGSCGFFYSNKKYNTYYVDKSRFLKYFGTKYKSICFTRPRRFGKMMNYSLISSFFGLDQDNRKDSLYEDLIVSRENGVMFHYQKHPVIELNLSMFGEAESLNHFENKMFSRIKDEFKMNEHVIESLNKQDLSEYKKLFSNEEQKGDCQQLLRFCCRILREYHDKHYYGEKVIVLINEYDSPLNNNIGCDFFKEASNFLSNLFSSVIKDNDDIYFSVFIGCIYSRFNNFLSGSNNIIHSSVIQSYEFSDFFGFNEKEVLRLLEYFGLSDYETKINEYYKGYLFGDIKTSFSTAKVIYNPFSIMRFCSDNCKKAHLYMTASYHFLGGDYRFLFKEDMETLLKLKENSNVLIPYDIDSLETISHRTGQYKSVVPLLIHIGYLSVKKLSDDDNRIVYLGFSNKELEYCFKNEFESRFGESEFDSMRINLLSKIYAEKGKSIILSFIGVMQNNITIFDNRAENSKNSHIEFLYTFLACGGIMDCRPDIKNRISPNIIQFSINTGSNSFNCQIRLYQGKSVIEKIPDYEGMKREAENCILKISSNPKDFNISIIVDDCYYCGCFYKPKKQTQNFMTGKLEFKK